MDRTFSAVLFDLDGTLLDSMDGHAETWGRVFADIGVHLEKDLFFEYEGNLEWSSLRDTAGLELSRLDFENLAARQRSLYLSEYAARVSFYPEATVLVDELIRAGTRLALATSSTREVLPPQVRSWLEERFSLIVTRDMVARGKPYPDPYLAALEGLGVDPGRAVVVENAPAGITAAKAAGLCCLALETTLPAPRLSQADRVFSGHRELRRWLLNRISASDA